MVISVLVNSMDFWTSALWPCSTGCSSFLEHTFPSDASLLSVFFFRFLKAACLQPWEHACVCAVGLPFAYTASPCLWQASFATWSNLMDLSGANVGASTALEAKPRYLWTGKEPPKPVLLCSFLASGVLAGVLCVCYSRRALNKGTICQERLYRNDKWPMFTGNMNPAGLKYLYFMYKLLIGSAASRMNFGYRHAVCCTCRKYHS